MSDEKPIGYANEDGNESRNVPVFERSLSEHQRKHMELRRSRKALEDEIAAVDKQRASLPPCDHSVFIDRDGFIYYIRECVICGASLGTV